MDAIYGVELRARNFFFWIVSFMLLGLIKPVGVEGRFSAQTVDGSVEAGGYSAGPFVDPVNAYPHEPAVLNGSLGHKERIPAAEAEVFSPLIQPLRYLPGQSPKSGTLLNSTWVDPVVQGQAGLGAMPTPLGGFPGLNFNLDGSGWPPDTNGDAGPAHYIQTVNTSIGIFDLGTGEVLYRAKLNDFFIGPVNTPCETSHRGDPIVLYDGFVDRWVVTDFAWEGNTGPYYECIAVSQTGDPINGGWYFYALRADTGDFENYLNDYPKLGVWYDGWYMTANMFEMSYPYRFGVRVWALDRERMIQGLPYREVHFDLCKLNDCGSLLPAHDNLAQGGGQNLPPNFLAAAQSPDQLLLWRFSPDFDTPEFSSLSGPEIIQTAPFATAPSIPQPEQASYLDSLSYRLMMQLQYSVIDEVESLWLNHTVGSTGRAAVRWYEIQQPNSGTPVLAQQGTYQPQGLEDGLHRWMGSLAVDQDGNMALGYSAGSETMYPSIRVAGRLAPETTGMLPQTEVVVKQGTGAQYFLSRWGDYTAMTVAPDGCTFYYTNEYYLETGSNWQTWIVPFRFPSCGIPKGTLQGEVLDAVSGQPIPNAPVIADGLDQTVTTVTDASGVYSLSLAEGIYSVTAGPIEVGYPAAKTVPQVEITAGNITSVDISLSPYSHLSISGYQLDDSGPDANGNGVPEPGEEGLRLWIGLKNDGAAAAVSVVSDLASLSGGVSLIGGTTAYADIQPGATVTQTVPYEFSILPDTACGEQLLFKQTVTDTTQTYFHDLQFDAAMSQPRQIVVTNDVERGTLLWRTEGTNNTWRISGADGYYSPTQAWTDSPNTSYNNYTNSSLVTPGFNLAGKRKVEVSLAMKYSLEPGWDFLTVEYSLDGGQTWEPDPLASFTGFQTSWQEYHLEAPALDGATQAALRFRIETDMSVVYQGVVLDDIRLTFEPINCAYPVALKPAAPIPLKPMAGELFYSANLNEVAFAWLRGPSGASVDGYRLFLDGSLVGETGPSQTEVSLPVEPGYHAWTVQAYNELGNSAEAALTAFLKPYVQIFPLVFLP